MFTNSTERLVLRPPPTENFDALVSRHLLNAPVELDSAGRARRGTEPGHGAIVNKSILY